MYNTLSNESNNQNANLIMLSINLAANLFYVVVTYVAFLRWYYSNFILVSNIITKLNLNEVSKREDGRYYMGLIIDESSFSIFFLLN
jgi:hypothetical protein